MADNIPRAVGVISGGQIMSLGDYASPFFFTSAFYLAPCIFYFVFSKKTERKITQKKIEDSHASDGEAQGKPHSSSGIARAQIVKLSDTKSLKRLCTQKLEMKGTKNSSMFC